MFLKIQNPEQENERKSEQGVELKHERSVY